MRRAIVGTGCLFALCRGIDSIVVPRWCEVSEDVCSLVPDKVCQIVHVVRAATNHLRLSQTPWVEVGLENFIL